VVAGAVVAGAATLVLLWILIVLRQRHAAAAAQWAHDAAELQRRAVHLEQSDYERQVHYNGTLNALAEAVDHLVHIQLPAALNGSEASQPLPDSATVNGEAAALCGRVTTAVAEGAARLRGQLEGLRGQLEDQTESSRLAVITLARRVQASAHRIQEEATRMAGRHASDTDVLESSMRVDHAAAQQARHAQSVAVLCGEWPGQQWPQPLPLLDVVRAASSRIVAYRRVTVSGEPDIAATATVVEPLIHLIAELLANATQSSPPTTQVLVTVRTVQRGAVIEMDDGGVGMEEHQLEQAREIVSGRRLLRLGNLGEIPQTGMPVIGQYVHRHGFRVDLMPSPYGGVRAVVLVPVHMVENLEQSETPRPLTAGPQAGAALTGHADVPAISAGSVPAVAATETGSLPHRRSRRSESATHAHGNMSPAESDLPTQTPEQAGAWMAAYFSGSPDEGTAPDPARSAPGADETTASPGGQAEAAHRSADPPGNSDPPRSSADSPGNELAQVMQRRRR
jgi:signal transduction histidine kinase